MAIEVEDWLWAAGDQLSGAIDPTEIGPAPAARNWLADDIDPTSATLKRITGGLHPVDAAVFWQFQVRLGAGPALGRNGNRFHEIKKADERAKTAMKQEAERILKVFVDRGWIRNDGIAVAVELDTGMLDVSYFNLLAQKPSGQKFKVR